MSRNQVFEDNDLETKQGRHFRNRQKSEVSETGKAKRQTTLVTVSLLFLLTCCSSFSSYSSFILSPLDFDIEIYMVFGSEKSIYVWRLVRL